MSDRPRVQMDAIKSLAAGARVLYVEDEPLAREELAELFKGLFDEVDTAADGQEGLIKYNQNPYDLVITDIHMPRMSGLEMVAAIQQLKSDQAFVVTSAYSEAQYLISLINMGVSSFILKPVTLNQILWVLQKELTLLRAKQDEEKYRLRLEKEVQIRTQEVMEASARMTKLLEARTNMLALVSHEIRTPLNGILGFSEILKNSPLDPELKEFAKMIWESAQRLDLSTTKALDFIRFKTGTKSIQIQSVDFSEFWKALVKERELKGSRLKIQETGNQKITLQTDPSFLGEAIKNILDNSEKYSVDNPQIHLEVVSEDRWIQMVFRDFGPGFLPLALDHIFQPFTSGDMMKHQAGLGLGLALCDVIMFTLGGKITAENHPQGGALVKLWLPKK